MHDPLLGAVGVAYYFCGTQPLLCLGPGLMVQLLITSTPGKYAGMHDSSATLCDVSEPAWLQVFQQRLHDAFAVAQSPHSDAYATVIYTDLCLSWYLQKALTCIKA